MSLVLYSERLTLTPFDAADVDLAIEMFTDPDVLKFAGGIVEEGEIRKDMSNWIKRDAMAASVSGVSQIEAVAKKSAVLLCCPCQSKKTTLISVLLYRVKLQTAMSKSDIF